MYRDGLYMKKIIILLLCFLFCSCASKSKTKSLKVMVEETEGMKVLSTNPINVEYGNAASFDVEIDSEYKLLSCNYGSYIDGKITVPSVKRPVTIKCDIKRKGDFEFKIVNNKELGEVVTTHVDGMYDYGTRIQLEVRPKSNNIFLAFSKDKSMFDGGKVLSYDRKIDVILKEDTTIYVDYKKDDLAIIAYHGNGGTLISSDSDEIVSGYTLKHHKRANTLQGSNYFKKPKHTMIGWNIKADGSGTQIGLGSRITVSKNSFTHLYASWKKWTNGEYFSYTNNVDGSISISGFSGLEEEIVIPEMIDGKEVTTISQDAFKDLNVKSIIFPKTLKKVEQSAFSNIPNLSSITYFDSLKEIYDASFLNCKNLERVFINANTPPKYITYQAGWIADKYDSLLLLQGPKMVLYGGSSCLHGFNSTLINETFKDFTTYNFGWVFASSPRFLLSLIRSTFKNGDKLMIAAENNWLIWGDKHNFSDRDWQLVEGNYDMLQYANIKLHTEFFDTYTQVTKQKEKMEEKTYEDYIKGINEFGDATYNVANHEESWTDGHTNFAFNKDTLDNRLDWVNENIAEMKEEGIDSYLTFPPYNINGVLPAYSTPELRKPYMDAYGQRINCPLITNIEDCFYTGNYYYDTNYHMTLDGAKLRTEQFIKDLKKQLGEQEYGTI